MNSISLILSWPVGRILLRHDVNITTTRIPFSNASSLPFVLYLYYEMTIHQGIGLSALVFCLTSSFDCSPKREESRVIHEKDYLLHQWVRSRLHFAQRCYREKKLRRQRYTIRSNQDSNLGYGKIINDQNPG